MFCRNCGQQLNDGASFCTNCGEPAVKPTVQPVPPQPVPQEPPRPNPQYPNPQYRQGAAPVYAAPQQPQQRSSNALLIVIIVLLSVLVLLGIILLFVKQGYLLQRDGENGTHVLSGSVPPAETVPVPGLESTQNAAATAAPPPVNEPEGDPDFPQDSMIGGNYNPMEDPWALTTHERPELTDFEWCYGQFGWVRQAPENASYLSDVQSYNGGWKALIIYNPDDPNGIFTRELNNIEISVDDSHQVQVTIDWYLLVPDFSEYANEEDVEDSVFTGMVTNTGISASGPALISIDNFWHDSEKQYATGTITPDNGQTAYLAMVRP